MGTNYYWAQTPCKECGRFDERHIGKSSVGWVFALNIYPELGINDLPDWEERFARGVIRNEYGDRISPDEMRDTIMRRGNPSAVPRSASFHRDNYSMEGPHGLLRCDPERCSGVKPGAGTWDLHEGDFS